MYHLELRHFPRLVHRFNLSGEEIGAVAVPWVDERVIEVGEQKWSPHQATITILDGPEIPIEQISLQRGWSTVERESADVTERVLAEAREALGSGAVLPDGSVARGAAGEAAPAAVAPSPQGARVSAAEPAHASGEPSGASAAGADALALGVALGSLLGDDPTRLLAAWRSVAGRASGLAPSEALALAERELARESASEG